MEKEKSSKKGTGSFSDFAQQRKLPSSPIVIDSQPDVQEGGVFKRPSEESIVPSASVFSLSIGE